MADDDKMREAYEKMKHLPAARLKEIARQGLNAMEVTHRQRIIEDMVSALNAGAAADAVTLNFHYTSLNYILPAMLAVQHGIITREEFVERVVNLDRQWWNANREWCAETADQEYPVSERRQRIASLLLTA